MKKLSFFLMAMLVSLTSFATEVSIDLSAQGYANAQEITSVSLDDAVTVAFDKGTNSNTPKYYNTGKAVRVYGGGYFTITTTTGQLTKIELTFSTGEGANEITVDAGSYATGTWTGQAGTVKFTVGGTSGHRRIQKIAVTYGEVTADYVAAPSISGDVDFIESTEVSIAAGEGLKVYYTVDGNDPTNASAEYTVPFEVTTTTTVKAIAYNGENASEVASKTFTKATEVTCAEAKEIALKVSDNNVPTELTYVINAYVTEVIDQTLSSGQQRFWVADTKDGGQVLQSYYCNVPQVLKVGDYIQMFGKLTKYNTTPQMKNGDVTILPEPTPEPEHTYTVAGSSEAAFGTTWDPTNEANDMVKQEDGTYKWEKEGLELLEGELAFKVTEDHAWTVAYPGSDYKLAIPETGIYTVTITFNPTTQEVAATATKTGDVVIIPTIAMHGNFLGSWADTEEFTKAADEATATLTLTIEKGDYEFGMRIGGAGNWTSNGVAFTRENASAEVVAGSGNMKLAADVAGNYTFTWTYATNTLTITYPSLPVAMVGNVKRALQMGENVVVLTHEADGTAHLYNVVEGLAYEVSQEGVVAVDPENKGSYLAISDIAVTEDGKLVANNYNRCSFNDGVVESGYKRGTLTFYIWNDLAAAPAIWFQSKASSNSNNSDQGYTMALTGTSTNANILVSGVHNTQRGVRMSHFSVIDGQYEDTQDGGKKEPYYYYIGSNFKGASAGADAAVFNEQTQGVNIQFLASPLAEENWIIDGELVDPIEFTNPQTHGGEVVKGQTLSTDLGKKFNGATIVKVEDQVLMVAPYADAEGKLAGVKVLDITAGLAAATEVATANLDAAVEATAAATAVAVAEDTLTITLVADATIYTLNVELESEPDYMVIEDNITNLVIDLESMAIIGGPSTMWQVEVYLGLGQDNGDGTFTLTEESSVAIMGFDARFIDGYVYDIDVNAPAAKAVLHVEDSGFLYEIKLDMTSTPQESIVVVVEDATVQIDTIPMFGDVVEYALKMTANWTDTTDNTTYPVLVEVPVYYPEATEPSEMTCTVTIGGNGDTDPWLGFGEGTLTITTVDGVVTAKGIVANPYTGVAFDVTVSGKLPVVEPEATWTVAGAPASIFGTEWDSSNTANDMVKQEDGTYKWEKTDLTLAASNIQFKVVKNHAWDEAYPSANYDLAIAEAGIYTITITFNPATQEVVGTATKTGDAVVIPTIAIAGDMNGWSTTANEFVVSEDELTASLTLPLEAKDYGFKMIIAGGWTSDGATVTRENNTVVFTGANGDNSTLTADVAGDYTFTWTYATSTLVVTYPVASSVDNVQVNATAVKVIKNGQLIIIKNGKEYNAQGATLK